MVSFELRAEAWVFSCLLPLLALSLQWFAGGNLCATDAQTEMFAGIHIEIESIRKS
jgi:hypothetical protein